MFYTDQTPVEMGPTHPPPKKIFHQNGLKWPKMHFGSIFFFLENGFFQTHPPTKSGKFQIFFLTLPLVFQSDRHSKKEETRWKSLPSKARISSFHAASSSLNLRQWSQRKSFHHAANVSFDPLVLACVYSIVRFQFQWK